MSNIKVKEIPLQKLFVNINGNSKYTKTFCNDNKGSYPVYTSTTKGTFGMINTYDYDEENLSFATHGNAGKLDILTGKYSIGNNRMILKSLYENINLKYMKYILEPLLSEKAKTSSVSFISWNVIKDIKVPVPITDNEEFDIEEQEKIANTYQVLESKKKELQNKIEKMKNSYMEVNVDKFEYIEKRLSDIFEFKRGHSCTRTYCNKHPGSYPVYSANNVTPLAYIDSYDYDGRYISLSRNGIAGKITIFNERFTINEDRFILLPKINNIDYDYIKYTVEPILRGKRKGREGYNGQNEFTKLSFTILNGVKILLPINKMGEIDLEAQIKISQLYKKLDDIKSEIYDKVNQLINTEISLKRRNMLIIFY